MRAVILAAGYGTRLYPLTEEVPKPLLNINGKTILDHLCDGLRELPLHEVIVVTNHRFYPLFAAWKQQTTLPLHILNDGTMYKETRLGALGDLAFALQGRAPEDTLVIAGDNLLGFSLVQFVQLFQQKQSSLVALRNLHNSDLVRKKFGVALLAGSKVIQFQEKPENPCSTLAATACYLIHQKDLPHINSLVQEGKAENAGNLIQRLVEQSEVHGFVFNEPWFDVGDQNSLAEAQQIWRTR